MKNFLGGLSGRVALALTLSALVAGPVLATQITIGDNFSDAILMSHPTHDSSNMILGSFDLAAALGISPAQMSQYQILGATAVLSFEDDFDGEYSSSVLGDYSLVGQDAGGHNVYERDYIEHYTYDDESDYVGAGMPGMAGQSDAAETGWPDAAFSTLDLGLSQDYPSPAWPLFDPNGVYFTHTQHIRSGPHTGGVEFEFVVDATNLATLASTGSVGYYAYMVGVFSAGGYQPNDIFLRDATLTVEYVLVPEPSTALLLAASLGGLTVTRRRLASHGRPA